MSVTIRRIPDDEPEPTAPVAPLPTPRTATPAPVDPWADFINKAFGGAATQILAKRRCVFCQGRLRPYTEPKAGSAANRDYGVKPMLRCVKCGRGAS